MGRLQQGVEFLVRWLWSPGPTDALQEFFGYSWLWFFNAVTQFGSVYAVVVVAALALWFSGRQLSYGAIGAVILIALTNVLLWKLVGVPRPDAESIIVRTHLSVSSFPSGHVMTATALWGSLAVFSRFPKVAAAVIVGLVMISRLYLGAHYLGDVIGGAVIGVALVAVYSRLRAKISGYSFKLPFWVYSGLGLGAPVAILAFIGTTERGWELFGAALGVGVGMPLEYRYVRFVPADVPLRWQVLKLVGGLGVMLPLLLVRGSLDGNRPIVVAALMLLAALWGVLVAPALFSHWRLSRDTASNAKDHETL